MFHHIENHIEKMRQKEPHVKERYAFGVSLGITLVIFGFWIAAKRPTHSAVAVKPQAPVKALTASASDAFGYIKTFFFSNKAEYTQDNVEVLPGKN